MLPENTKKTEIFIPRVGGMKSIHTVDVRSAINNYSTNPITANRPLMGRNRNYLGEQEQHWHN